MNTYFLDLDGVIIDSINECYKVSKKAYYGFRYLEPEIEDEIRVHFFKYRGHVGPIYQYLALHRAIENVVSGKLDTILSIFRGFCNSIDKSERSLYETVFLAYRAVYQSEIENWISLNPLTDYGKSLQSKTLDNHYIITTKDNKSVALLLNYYDISVAGIYGKEHFDKFDSKGELMNQIMVEKKINEAIFIDDSVQHLDSVSNSNIKCLFADWGYGKNTNYEIFKY